MRNPLSLAGLKATFKKKGYAWSATKPNLIGLRTELNVPDVFNDVFVLAFTQPAVPKTLSVSEQQAFLNQFGYVGKNGLRLKEDGQPGGNTNYALECYNKTVGTERMICWTITTVPGVFYLQNPVPGGAAVLVPNQYVDVYMLGKHLEGKKSEQNALVQRGGEVTVYRDADMDNHAEKTERKSKGYFGINIHRALAVGRTVKIWNWSAGCQVFASKADHDLLLGICGWFKEAVKNRFTYTLLEEADLA